MNKDDFTKIDLNAEQVECLHKIGTFTFEKLAKEPVEALQYVLGVSPVQAKEIRRNAKIMVRRHA